jgi:hypothetical protein
MSSQLRAGHRPSELIPPGVHPAHVTVILPAPRSYVGPVVLVLSTSAGAVALILALTQLAIVLAPLFASLSVGGLTIAIRGIRHKSK